MKKKILAYSLLLLPVSVMAQSAFDIYQFSQREMRGTARYMSMAGAFGALGGDLSAINLNPGGIGIYRSSDVGITFDFDLGSTTAESGSSSVATDRFKFYCNNAGYVGAMRLDSDIMPNINWGFTYNRAASFNRHYRGTINNLSGSFSNYMAGVTAGSGVSLDDLTYDSYYKGFNPYLDGSAGWMDILAYNSYVTNVVDNSIQGLWGDGTKGTAAFETFESGGIDDFTFNFGGNVANTLYWGMSLGISSIEHNLDTYYDENLQNAYVSVTYNDPTDGNDYEEIRRGVADYGVHNYSRTTGTGVNFNLGVILKPINELRLGFAFHTPTYYSLCNEYYADVDYHYEADGIINAERMFTDDGYISEFNYNLRTPWRFVASAAAVIGGRGILSFDYEYIGNQMMEAEDDYGNDFIDLNTDVDNYYKASHIFKVGAEYRLTDNFSIRAGYSYQTSGSADRVRDNLEYVYTTHMPASYETENNIQHITFGLGYKYKRFYTDFAFVHRDRQTDYHAYSPVYYTDGGCDLPPMARINNYDNQIVWTLGIRF